MLPQAVTNTHKQVVDPTPYKVQSLVLRELQVTKKKDNRIGNTTKKVHYNKMSRMVQGCYNKKCHTWDRDVVLLEDGEADMLMHIEVPLLLHRACLNHGSGRLRCTILHNKNT